METSPIQAVAVFSHGFESDALGVYFNRYRGFAARAHAHAEGQLLVPLAGRMHLVSGVHAQVLGPEAAAWLPPGLPHGFVHVDGSLDFLAIEVDLARAPLMALAGAPGDRPLLARAPGLWHVARAIAHELESRSPGYAAQILTCLPALWGYLERALAPGTPAIAAGSSEVRLVVDAILADYASELRVPALAAMVGLSERQLERRFQLELGRSPKRFLTEVRMGAARTLLGETDHPIARIALEVGFANPSHFAATFKAHTGLHPHALRLAR